MKESFLTLGISAIAFAVYKMVAYKNGKPAAKINIEEFKISLKDISIVSSIQLADLLHAKDSKSAGGHIVESNILLWAFGLPIISRLESKIGSSIIDEVKEYWINDIIFYGVIDSPCENKNVMNMLNQRLVLYKMEISSLAFVNQTRSLFNENSLNGINGEDQLHPSFDMMRNIEFSNIMNNVFENVIPEFVKSIKELVQMVDWEENKFHEMKEE